MIYLYIRNVPPVSLLNIPFQGYRSLLGQDQWVHKVVYPHLKHPGYFVDIGAYDGVDGSNSYYFEKILGWKGILVEPDPITSEKCRQYRSNTVEQVAVDDTPGEVFFIQHGKTGKIINNKTEELQGQKITVKTDTLVNILDRNEAPSFIHYLSMDIEGNEYKALKDFPFDRYTFGALTIENTSIWFINKDVRNLLEKNGYVYAGKLFVDDLYVHETMYTPNIQLDWRWSVIIGLIIIVIILIYLISR